MSRKNKNKGTRWPAWYTPVERPPLPVTQVRYDGALWTVDGSPCLRSGGVANFCRTALLRRTDTELVLRPAVGAILFGLVFVVIGTGVTAAFVSAVLDGKFARVLQKDGWSIAGDVVGVVLGAAFVVAALAMSLGMMSRVVRFDKSAGTMTRRTLLGTERTVPLADVVAVQAIYAGRASGSGRGGGPYDVLQVNLIVAVGDKKVNVVSEPEEGYVRKLAADLAAFLGVPLVDQVADTRRHHGR